MSQLRKVLAVPLVSGGEDESLLLNAECTSLNPLRISITGTEGIDPYVGSIEQAQLVQLQAKGYEASLDDFEGIILFVFFGIRKSSKPPKFYENIEMDASLEPEKLATITIHRNIEGITQRLGSFLLKYMGDEEVSIFDWASHGAKASAKVDEDFATLSTKFAAQAQTIKKLNDQLQAFLKAKEEHENVLLEKFRDILNSKKLKIRDQQRLLATAKVDPARVAQLESARSTALPRKANLSRASKRKTAVTSANSDSGSDAFSNIAVDNTIGEEKPSSGDEAIENRETTPEPFEDESTDSEEAAASPPPARRGEGKHLVASSSPRLPIPQDLPFTKRPPEREIRAASKLALKPDLDLDNDETDDDEL